MSLGKPSKKGVHLLKRYPAIIIPSSTLYGASATGHTAHRPVVVFSIWLHGVKMPNGSDGILPYSVRCLFIHRKHNIGTTPGLLDLHRGRGIRANRCQPEEVGQLVLLQKLAKLLEKLVFSRKARVCPLELRVVAKLIRVYTLVAIHPATRNNGAAEQVVILLMVRPWSGDVAAFDEFLLGGHVEMTVKERNSVRFMDVVFQEEFTVDLFC